MNLRNLKNIANLRILTGAITTAAMIIGISWFVSDQSHEPLLAMLAGILAFISFFKYSFLSFDRNLVSDRIALIVGNKQYRNSPPLINSVNDAEAVCEKLRKLGFRTIKKIDPTTNELRKAIYDFQTILSVGGVGLFYYSGHASQIDGDDYILPVDVILDSSEEFRKYAINLNDLLGPVDKIIDDSPEHNGSIAIYSTASGGIAFDSFIKPENKESSEKGKYEDGKLANETQNQSSYSPFAEAFLSLCDRWNLELFDLFRKLCQIVPKATENSQVPWISASVNTEFYFKPIIKEDIGVLKILIFDACRTAPFFRPRQYYGIQSGDD